MKTATETTTAMEAALGPRGRIAITKDNRGNVRKWLSAQGFPAMFSGALSYKELSLAYNDVSGRELQKLRHKLDGAIADAGEDNIDPQPNQPAPRQPSILDAIAGAESSNTPPRTAPDMEAAEQAALKAARDMLQEENNRLKEGRPSKPAKGANPQGENGQASDEVEEAAQKLAEAIRKQKQTAPQIDREQVREIMREEVKGLESKIREMTTSRIEVKTPDREEVTILEGRHHPEFTELLECAASRQNDGFRPNILISGPAGSGKTFSARKVIESLGLEFHYNGALSMAHEVLGYKDANGVFHETAFFRGYTRKAGYLFDEVDGSQNSPLLALNAALANGCASFPNGNVDRHPDSLIIATANTWGLGATADYVGRNKLDAAFLSRFPIRIYWGYDEALEREICGHEAWALRVQKARANAAKAGIKVLICPRITLAGAALINTRGFTLDRAAKLTYLANLTPEQRQIVDRA